MGWFNRVFGPRLVSPTADELDAWAKGQHGEDRYIQSLLTGRSAPFVVDVGANDGFSWSNSYLFRKLGYQLLLIEPMPKYAALCRTLYAGDDKVRIEESAIADQRGEVDFYVNLDVANDLLAMGSSLDQAWVPSQETQRITVRAEPLSDVLARANCPSRYALLSIDAEGRDLDVLKTAALDRFRPEIICVEEGLTSPIPTWLAERGYDLINRLGVNSIYRRG